MTVWQRNFTLVWLNNFITAVGMMAFLPLFPLVLRDLGLDSPATIEIWSGLLVAGAPLTAAFMGPLWGALGDRVGRKPMVVRANFAILIFVGAMSLATSAPQLLVLRLMQGVFSGFMAPSITLVSVATPLEQQGRVTGWLSTAVTAGSVLGPVLGGAVADAWGFRAVFLVTAALSGVGALVVKLWVVEPPVAREAQPSATGSRVPAPGLLLSVWRDLLAFLAPGPLRTLLLIVFALRFAMRLVDPTLALYVELLGDTPPERLATVTGLLFAATAAATLAFTPLWGRWGDHRGHGRMLAACAAAGALLFAAQGLVTGAGALYPLRFLAGAVMAGTLPAAYALTARASSAARRGSALGLTFSSQVLANALGPAAGGLLAAAFGLRPPFFVAAAIMALAALAAVRARGRSQAATNP